MANTATQPFMPQVAKFGVHNGMVPGCVPDCLKALTMVEQQMIARAHPVVKMFHTPGGQRHFNGHVVSINQDITTLATERGALSRRRYPFSSFNRGMADSWAGRQFIVSVDRVQTALAWLIANSPAYAGVRVDTYTGDIYDRIGN